MIPSLYKPSYLQQLCKKYDLIPSRHYGQNFLINPEPIEKMLELAQVSKNDKVVEVGPGFGVLTLPLSEKVKKVYSFEIEKKLQPYWEEQIKKYPNIEIIWGNVLKQFETMHVGTNGRSALHQEGIGKSYKVIANLPYQITSSVIRLFLESECPPEIMVLMVQKEVGERICAKPGSMSLLSVAIQYYSTPEYITEVPRSYFWPEPGVDSAVVRLKLHNQNKREEEKKFFQLVKAGFANRRKLLFKNLLSFLGKQYSQDLLKVFDKLKLERTARAQELSTEEWKMMAKYVSGMRYWA